MLEYITQLQPICVHYMVIRLLKICHSDFWVSFLNFVINLLFNIHLSTYYASRLHTLFLQNWSTSWGLWDSASCFHHFDLCWTSCQTSTQGHCHAVLLKHFDCTLKIGTVTTKLVALELHLPHSSWHFNETYKIPEP